MDTTECIAYLENNYTPCNGDGFCLQMHEPMNKAGDILCQECKSVLARCACPRKKNSPYLKAGEKS